jgi:phosphoesterase RecJ-like protein
MELNYKSVSDFRRIVDGKNKFLMLFDCSPDGDQIGASYALGMWLRSLGKDVVWTSRENIPECYRITNFSDEIIKEPSSYEDYDVVILNDCADLRRIPLYNTDPEFLENSYVVNFDHHPSNKMFGDLNFVHMNASATSEVIYYLLKELGAHIDPEMATYLLMGISSDTGGFIHSNVSADVFNVCSSLLQRGASITKSVGSVKYISLDVIKLWGKLIQDVRIHNGVCSLYIDKTIMAEEGISTDDLSGMSSLLATIPDIKYGILLVEINGEIRGSLRTNRDDVDVMNICQNFEGGGHKKAAGFVIKTTDIPMKEKLLNIIGL